MKNWESDNQLFEWIKEKLFTALVGDVLDKMGFFHQFLPQHIKPLSDSMVLIGRAMPVLETDVFAEKVEGSANPILNKPFGLMFEALDSLKHNDIYIGTGASYNYDTN